MAQNNSETLSDSVVFGKPAVLGRPAIITETHCCAICKTPFVQRAMSGEPGYAWFMYASEMPGELGDSRVCEKCRDDIKHGGHREVVDSRFGGTIWVPRKVDTCESCDVVTHVTQVGTRLLCAKCAEPDENACAVCGLADGTHYEAGKWICDGCADSPDDVQELD